MAERYIYIHGVTEGASHRGDYAAMRDGLVGAGVDLPSLEAPESICIEWGWPDPSGAAGNTAALAVAQKALHNLATTAPKGERPTPSGVLWGPLVRSVRRGFLTAPADLAYYLGAGGKVRVRQVVWGRILDSLGGVEPPVELTLIGHSAGSLIAHDLLFWLFSGARDSRLHEFAAKETWEHVREACRLRRLVTLGSPFTPFLVRSAKLVDRVTAAPPPWLDPSEIGLVEAAIWLNVWDEHDVVSYPVAGVYQTDRAIDVYADHSDRPLRAHAGYWSSRRVHAALAAAWDA